MAEFDCNPLSQCDKLKAGRKVLETPTDPEHSDALWEHRAMSNDSGYSAAVCADKSERTLNIAGCYDEVAA